VGEMKNFEYQYKFPLSVLKSMFLEMQDHFTHNFALIDRAKLTAVNTVWMGSDYLDFIRVERVYVLDHRPIFRVPKDDGISPLK